MSIDLGMPGRTVRAGRRADAARRRRGADEEGLHLRPGGALVPRLR